MKVALISPYESVVSYGVRILSAALKKEGFETRLFFIPFGFEVDYPESLYSGMLGLIKGCDCVGISLTSNYFNHARSLTNRIKKDLRVPVIWGGIHPTIEPEECLLYADYVVMGEGEISFPSLLKKLKNNLPPHDIKGIAFNKTQINGEKVRVKNPPMPLIENLDEIVLPDYSFDGHYIWGGGAKGAGGQGDKGVAAARVDAEKIKGQSENLWRSLTPELFVANAGNDYLTLSSRGCPYSCSFCCNSFLKNFYEGERWFRKRSINNLLVELKEVKEKYPFFKRVYYDDDAFMHRPVGEIKLFAQRMKNEIGLPFVITGVTPTSLTDEKLDILIDAGLKWIRLGIQTVSDRVNKEVYHRPTTFKSIKSAIEIIRRHHKKMDPVWYDFVIDNPWETSSENLETLRFMLDLPRPFAICIYSLTFFPGAKISERAIAEKLITDKYAEVYMKSYKDYKKNYINNLFMFFTLSRLPKWVLKLFVNKFIIMLGLNYPLWRVYTFLRDYKAKRR